MRRVSVLILALLVAVAAVAVASGPIAAQRATQGRAIRVVTGMAITQDFVRRVGGDHVEAFSIVPAGADPHTYQPTPRDVQALQGARLAVWNGLGLDETAADLVAEQGLPDLTVVVLSEGIAPLAEDDHDHEAEAHEEADEHGHAQAGGNPHLWLDPAYAVRYVERIRDALVEVDPANAEAYQANAAAYVDEINALDAWAQGEIATIPAERRKLVTFHDAFPYFAEAYGFELVGVVLENPDAEPGSREMADVVRTIKEEGVPAVFTEPQFNAELADTIAREAGVEVYELYSDTLVKDEAAETYEAMMRTNVDRISEALR